MSYYQDFITTKSFQVLQDLKHRFNFILIGGWAVFLYTHQLKSKDIDVIIEYEELQKFRNFFALQKNDRLKKYEVKLNEVDLDIYLPFYSTIALPTEDIKNYVEKVEGFILPKMEILLILKQAAYRDRKGSIKGKKDKIDIVGLCGLENFDFKFYQNILRQYHLENFSSELKDLLNSTGEMPELGLNQHRYAKFKQKICKSIFI